MRPRRPRRRLPKRLIGTLALVLVSLWLGGFLVFLARIPEPSASPAEDAEVIVVLTGGSARLQEGLQLLAQHRAPKLFVSGVNPDTSMRDMLSEAAEVAASPITEKQAGCCIVLGQAAGNTRENARETADWMAQHGFTSLILVTADYHMPRSLLEFQRAMPGVMIQPHAVFPAHVRRDDWWRWPGTAMLLASEYTKYLLAILRGGARAAPPQAPAQAS